MPQATLITTPNMAQTSLILPDRSLEEPVPTDGALADDYVGYCYRGTIWVKTSYQWPASMPTAMISTAYESRRGQMKTFDALVGPRIAGFRRAMRSDMNRIRGAYGHCDAYKWTVFVEPEEIFHMRRMIQVYAQDSGKNSFFAARDDQLGVYNDPPVK